MENSTPSKRRKVVGNSDASESTEPSRSCPYLGTVNPQILDFDFEKLCSVSSAKEHVYCCLVCGKYFQGRGKSTFAFIHSLEEGHHVFLNLTSTRAFCLPDNYEITDASLNDIKYFLHPTYSPPEVTQLDKKAQFGKALDGTDFIPGCVGLNNLKKTDYANVVVQLLCRVVPLRNALLLTDMSTKQKPDPIVSTLSELIRKIFNAKNFKGIVSPHEFLQAASVESAKMFRIGEQADPVDFLKWLLNRLQRKMKNEKGSVSNVVRQCFEGELLVRTSNSDETAPETELPFLCLSLDVPAAPVFKDAVEGNIIPQVPIFDLLQKFSGDAPQESLDGPIKRFTLWKLPDYLLVHVKRFSKNNFFVEKNPTLVTFPVRNLDLQEYLHPDAQEFGGCTRYNLLANVCHEGQPQGGIYKVHVLHAVTNEWYEVEDLRVSPVLPQLVALSESYLQLYQRCPDDE